MTALTTGSRARLGAYLYHLRLREQATSTELGDLLGINPTQVRRDLSTVLGKLGKRGHGYRSAVVIPAIQRALAGDATGAGALVLIGQARTVDRTDDDDLEAGYLRLGAIEEAARVVCVLDAAIARI